MSCKSRYSPTNDIGVAILKLCISKELGWICREITQSDVGIDATIEQIIDGNPTAKYISVQLKTGEGNIHIDRDGNFIYYIDNVHYSYWLSSSIPVILAYCDPSEGIIYWELLKKNNISRTSRGDGGHKIKILNTHQLGKGALEELNIIIDTYQTDFELPEMDDEDVYDIEFWSELLENCAEAISNSRLVIEQLDEKYRSHNDKMTNFLELNKSVVDKKIVDKNIAKHAKSFKIAIDMCKMQFKSQIPIIAKTHIEAIRLVERAMNNDCQIPVEINCLLQEELNREIMAIKGVKEILTLAIERFEQSSSPIIDLRRAEFSFAQVFKDYDAELSSIIYCIEKLMMTLRNTIS